MVCVRTLTQHPSCKGERLGIRICVLCCSCSLRAVVLTTMPKRKWRDEADAVPGSALNKTEHDSDGAHVAGEWWRVHDMAARIAGSCADNEDVAKLLFCQRAVGRKWDEQFQSAPSVSGDLAEALAWCSGKDSAQAACVVVGRPAWASFPPLRADQLGEAADNLPDRACG